MNVVLLLLPLLFFNIPGQVDSAWWYFSQFDQVSVRDDRIFCKIIPHLNKRQRQICGRHSRLVGLIGDGVRQGIKECQFQFKYQKWNCSTFINDSSLFGKLLVKGGTREAAFLQAMHSASAIYTLAKICSKGDPKCGCSSEIPNGQPTNTTKYDGQFKWDGCDHVVKFSTNFVRRFIDAAEMDGKMSKNMRTKTGWRTMSDGKAKFTLHNNKVGRIIIRNKMEKVCKCHGVSGSCSMKTCWNTLPSFRMIGDALRDKYDAAMEVTFKPSGRIIPQGQEVKGGGIRVTKHTLIYYERSPDYCRLNLSLGSVGTKGRECVDSSDGEESCDILCCREKYESTKVRYSHICNCTFSWCCQVNCHLCNSTRILNRCKY